MRLNSEAANLIVKSPRANIGLVLGCLIGAMVIVFGGRADAQGTAGQVGAGQIRIVAVQGTVEVMPAGATSWVITQTNQLLNPGDQLRTADNSRVTILWSDQSVVPLGPLTQIEVLAPDKPSSLPGMDMVKGILSFFHRDNPGRIRVLTHGANASIEGTEFVIQDSQVNGVEHDTFSVFDGKVLLSNAQGAILLTNEQQAFVEPGKAPVRTAGFIANNLLQWCFYYPAVLDLRDLPLTANEESSLQESLDAYRTGDLLVALAKYPDNAPVSDSVRVYHAALLLSVGEVEKTEAELAQLPAESPTNRLQRLADSLQMLIAAVKRQERSTALEPQLPTELLAASYYAQSQAKGDESLSAALSMAREATARSPQFGFAWERVAELEFGFGRTPQAMLALNQSLELSPRNAEAQSLKGFLLASQNRIGEAMGWFDRAIATDGALGNAWLGLGLCCIRIGQTDEGLHDLMVAAASEPQRSLLRSYLAKGYSYDGRNALANREIAIALRLDPGDPTAWLYSALIKQQENRVNEAIKDMEQSQSLNDNRRLFRSQMLLDQDRAVRSVNMATMYNDAGMTEVGVREAAKAVTDDYANSSAHLFLSDSYNLLRDPTGVNLRYETAWFNELLLANMLAPVGAGRLSQTLSSQEYSKLFESDGMGIASQTTYLSDGQVGQTAAQFGTYKNTSWALDFDYQHNKGIRPNNQLDDINGAATVKQQLTSSDTVLAIVQLENFHSGDNFQYYDPNNPSTVLRTNFEYSEQQSPTVVGGYQHEWAPGVRTLLLGGRLDLHQQFTDVQANQLTLIQVGGTPPPLQTVTTVPFDVQVEDQQDIYTAELSQIVQKDRYTLVAGGRWQGGQFNFSDLLTNAPLPSPLVPIGTGSFSEPFQRFNGYGYLTVEPIDNVWLTGGLAYDAITYPSNYRNPPQSAGTSERHLLEPKAALVWSPIRQATVRGIYARSLGGVSIDDSYRLEPTELAGFVQTFRSVIPESVVGSVSAEDVEMEGLALDLKFNHGTFAGLQFQNLHSSVNRTVGAFLLPGGNAPLVQSSTPQDLSYGEQSFSATINQLLPYGFVTGFSYSLTHSELKTTYPDLLTTVTTTVPLSQDQSAYLHRLGAYLLLNHPSGFFAEFDAHAYFQQNYGYAPAEPGDDFVQLDVLGGWRFFDRRAQLTVGVLNLTGGDYHLNPLNLYEELPRQRVFMAQLSFQF
jgi:tetratricopeptide (TPR) repeat protein